MTPELRTQMLIARINNYTGIMFTTMFVFVGVAVGIELGGGGYSAPLTMLAIGAVAYGVLAGGSALDDMTALRDDMDEATAATNYGKTVGARNIPMLKKISSVLIILIGLAELYAIFV